VKKKSLAALALVLALFLGILWHLHGTKESKKPLERSGFLFDTVIAVSLYDKQDEAVLDEAFQLLEQYEEIFSPTKSESELYRMNHRGSGVTTWKASPAMLDMVKLGLRYSELSDGAFDVTVLPLSSLWSFSGGEAKVPAEADIETAVSKVDYRHVRIDGDVIDFGDDVTQIDSGSTAKGYIADRLKDFLVEKGVKSAIINLGGNVLCIGEKAKGEPFHIAIRKPEEHSNEVVKILDIDGLSVVSSGVYERFFDLDGVHYHHILNPRTGYPYQNGLVSVTIVGPSSAECDALSTAVFSLGREEGMALLEKTEGYYGYMILEDGSILASAGAQPGKNP